MNKETFKEILNNEQGFSCMPDAVNRSSSQPDYIRFLVTRARVLHGDMSRDDVVKKCGISLSSLNKYVATSSSRHIPCPYSVQFLLERLAKLEKTEMVAIFRLKMSVPTQDVGFFSQFDNFMRMTGGISDLVEISTVLTSGEVKKLIEKDVQVY